MKLSNKKLSSKKAMLIISVKVLFAFATGFVGGCVFQTVTIPYSLSMPIGYFLGIVLSSYLK